MPHCTCIELMLNFLLHSEDDEPGGSPWWAGRGDFSHPELEPSGICRDKSDISYKCGEGGSDVSSNLEDIKKSSQKKAVTFTEYSMTSSIVPRSEGTCTCTVYCTLSIEWFLFATL